LPKGALDKHGAQAYNRCLSQWDPITIPGVAQAEAECLCPFSYKKMVKKLGQTRNLGQSPT